MKCLCFSPPDTEEDNHSNAIERAQLSKPEDLTITILLLGTANSGKTTILKQIKRINHKYDVANLNNRREATQHIKSAPIEYMQILCEQSLILHQKFQHDTIIDSKYDCLAKEILALQEPHTLNSDIAFKIKTLWYDKGIQATFSKRSYFQIDDNVDYFLNKIDSISDDGYLPDYDDYLRFSEKTIGITRNIINLDIHSFKLQRFEFIDVKGNRPERRKWTNFISGDANIDAVLYVIPLSDYDLMLFEDNATNCLVESINVFRNTMIEGNFFDEQMLVVLFNKYDEFEKKIKRVPITVAFDDFPTNKNPNDASHVLPFIAAKLYSVYEEKQHKPKEPLRIIRTTAIEKDHMEEIVNDIADELVKRQFDHNNTL